MTIISTPLNIGAADLLRGVEFTLSGILNVFVSTLFGKKCKRRYAIVSQGCFYIYQTKKSKKADQAFSLTDFKSAQEDEPYGGEEFCFKLTYKNTQTPLLFAVDTHQGRELWIGHLSSAIVEVQAFNKLSADSGYESAGNVPTVKFGESVYEKDDDETGYDEVDVRKFEQANYIPAQPEADENVYEIPIVTKRSKTRDNDRIYENVEVSLEVNPTGNMKVQIQQHKEHIVNESKPSTSGGSTVKKGSCNESSATGDPGNTSDHTQTKVKPVYMEELKGILENGRNDHKRDSAANKPKAKPNPDSSLMNLSRHWKGNINTQASVCLPSTASGFASVREGDSSTAIEESLPFVSLRGEENESSYQINGDSDNSTDSDNMSPEIFYENIILKKFRRESYFLEEKKEEKKEVKQVLKRKPDGTFAVFPGETTGHEELCVKTQAGLKYFCIFSQIGQLFLDISHHGNRFSTLDDLLSYYHDHDIPHESGYSVKLKMGYKHV